MNDSQTPVTASDRVSDVLARNESLVEVFVRHSPHFAKLRNRTMRNTMARLVTVAHAAQIAGISTEKLLHDLNEALGISSCPDDETSSMVSASTEAGPTHPESAHILELDVRDELRSGGTPFSKIMHAVGELRVGDVLLLRTTLEPVPLYAVLAKRDFVYEARTLDADDWSVWFWRPGEHATT